MGFLQFCSPSYDSFLPLFGVALIYVVSWHPTTAPNTSIPYELSSVSKILKVQKGNVARFETADTPFPSVTWADRSRSSKAASRKQSALLISGPGNGYGYITCAKANRKTSFCASTCRSRSVRSCKPRRNSSSRSDKAVNRLESFARFLFKQNHGEVARKVLRGVNSHRTQLGNDLFEKCCQATLTRLTPSYKVLCEEVDAVTDNRTRRFESKSCDQSQLPPEDIRGSAYYDQLLTQTTGENK